MKITNIEWANEERTGILISTTSGETLTSPWPCTTWHGELVDEWTRTGGRFAEPTVDLEAERLVAAARVDRGAEAARTGSTTSGAVQSMVYDEKFREATAFVAGDTGPFPLIEAEAAATAQTEAAVAAAVIGARTAWVARMASIEGKRIAAKRAITSAGSLSLIRQLADVDWTD